MGLLALRVLRCVLRVYYVRTCVAAAVPPTQNYGIVGLLALNATLGTRWGTLSLLLAMGFFLVVFPFSLACFEWERWAVGQHLEVGAAAGLECVKQDGGDFVLLETNS